VSVPGFRVNVDVTTTRTGSVHRVTVMGDIDADTLPHVEAATTAAVTDATAVLLDLTPVSFLSAAGTRWLLAFHDTLTTRGTPLAIACSRPATRALTTTGASPHLDHHPTNAEALDSLTHRTPT
jgi:anti-anti-sigma factor